MVAGAAAITRAEACATQGAVSLTETEGQMVGGKPRTPRMKPWWPSFRYTPFTSAHMLL